MPDQSDKDVGALCDRDLSIYEAFAESEFCEVCNADIPALLRVNPALSIRIIDADAVFICSPLCYYTYLTRDVVTYPVSYTDLLRLGLEKE